MRSFYTRPRLEFLYLVLTAPLPSAGVPKANYRGILAVSDGVLYTHGPPVLMVVATRLCKLLRPNTNLCSHLLEGW